jgi:hypothetical protein
MPCSAASISTHGGGSRIRCSIHWAILPVPGIGSGICQTNTDEKCSAFGVFLVKAAAIAADLEADAPFGRVNEI